MLTSQEFPNRFHEDTSSTRCKLEEQYPGAGGRYAIGREMFRVSDCCWTVNPEDQRLDSGWSELGLREPTLRRIVAQPSDLHTSARDRVKHRAGN